MCSASCCVCDDSSMSLITLSCAVASLLFRRASSSCRSTATLRIHSRFAATRLACHPPAPGNQRRRAHGASRAALTSTAKARTPVTSLLRFIFIAPARWRGDVVSLSKLSLSTLGGRRSFPAIMACRPPAFAAGEESGNPVVEFAEVCMCVRWRCAVLDRARRRSHSGDFVSPRMYVSRQASGEESLEDLAGARLPAHGAHACAPVDRVPARVRACVRAGGCMFVACIEQAQRRDATRGKIGSPRNGSRTSEHDSRGRLGAGEPSWGCAPPADPRTLAARAGRAAHEADSRKRLSRAQSRYGAVPLRSCCLAPGCRERGHGGPNGRQRGAAGECRRDGIRRRFGPQARSAGLSMPLAGGPQARLPVPA
jgi:hypothetical protein